MTELDEIEGLFEVLQDLKHTEREGWKKRGVESPADTIASHSFGAALLAWVLAEERGLDSGKMVKMLLVHDLIMAYIQDYTPEESEYSSKKEFEREKMEELEEDLPEAIREEASQLIEEIRDQETALASNAKEADKLETILQAMQYSEKVPLKEFLEYYEDYSRTEDGEELFQGIKHRYEEEKSG